jgi:hypothetical protein
MAIEFTNASFRHNASFTVANDWRPLLAIADAAGGRCAVQDDPPPGLSIRSGTNCKVFVRCHAGGGQNQIAAILKAQPLSAALIKRPPRCWDFGNLLTTEMGVTAR